MKHYKVTPGIYKKFSSGFVTVWDVHIKSPNTGESISPEILHTIEHTMNSYLKYKYGNYRIIGVFPMGCQTGLRVVTRFIGRDTIFDVILEYIDSLDLKFDLSYNDCTNHQFHNLKGAKDTMKKYLKEYLIHQYSALNYK